MRSIILAILGLQLGFSLNCDFSITAILGDFMNAASFMSCISHQFQFWQIMHRRNMFISNIYSSKHICYNTMGIAKNKLNQI